jgi:MFS transporter, MCT family, solute carrier family 16 (monocarboxylic acid transporters), member 10
VADSPLAKDDPTLSTTLLSLLFFGRGFGNVLATPISTSLLRAGTGKPHGNTGFGVDGGKYARLIVFAGACYAGAALLALGWCAVQRRRGRHVTGASI